MGRKAKKGTKRDRDSDSDSSVLNYSKQQKPRGPSEELEKDEISVSEILNKVNNILYCDTNNDSFSCVNLDLSSVFESSAAESTNVEMASKNDNADTKTPQLQDNEPTNRDIMSCLIMIGKRIDDVEQKLKALNGLNKKMDDFDVELKSIRRLVNDHTKKVGERLQRLEDKVDGTDINVGLMASRVEELEKERDSLRDDVAYLKSQSMRNNLIFTGVTETGSNETYEQTEAKLRQHLVDAMKIQKEVADNIRFERVHRSPSEPQAGKTRSIVAKFTYFKDRELVRKQWKTLSGTRFNVFEQFPPEVVAKRKKLVPKMKEARRQGKKSWIVYDTLFVDGKAVKSE